MSKNESAVCIDSRDHEVSLETRKLYEVLSDIDEKKYVPIRVIDESRENYLHSVQCFYPHCILDNVIEQVISVHAQNA